MRLKGELVAPLPQGVKDEDGTGTGDEKAPFSHRSQEKGVGAMKAGVFFPTTRLLDFSTRN
ncbi:MAG: hypothetical protein K0S99_1371 [Thermomicrobiales bacterium]|nr:hypothetical protein [Thermomicrobiales bacterium]